MLPLPPFLILAILWTIAVNGAAPTSSDDMNNRTSSIANLSCLFFDDTKMNCTWDIDGKAQADAQYILSYMVNGKHQSKINKYGCSNTACHVQKFELFLFGKIKICVQLSQSPAEPHCIVIVPITYYKVSPPIQVKINESKVEWKPPGGIHPFEDFFYQIEITDRSDGVKKIKDVESTKWSIENWNKRYSVRVRAKINNYLPDAIWSDWSQAVNIEPAVFKDWTLPIVITLIISGVLVVLFLFICRRYILLENLCQPIPDPKNRFKGLIDNHNGDFQEWINAKQFKTKVPEECIAVAVDDEIFTS
ncbi:interleukin-5 receptor subunit alpha-like isoform X2 [Scyliorhinus canicula]|uniref:interleukin-5 receptor subunit alpha-like isoform X2 n=1 Tax=Scyliorhinus canicula TaxID=7830 RepID=UPI0018F46A59|nr:interleukin-5 receptor subunit alpha-like isoform X2 [Scyliorhinus canicula]XP_038674953.1 interleukin-5 receptor subunit alpha-like isoform X2 [Scyliorhinus canicula]XP_038674954.1 interleukin-5 receptor subunit alpha-like isoform X2 [Scyliorhinus canicula]